MTFSFKPSEGLIIVDAEVVGTEGSAMLKLALDTGASQSVVSANVLASLGYRPYRTSRRIPISTASGTELLPSVKVKTLSSIGLTRKGFSVLAHDLPASSGVRGVIGLDFLSSTVLTLDFRKGEIEVR